MKYFLLLFLSFTFLNYAQEPKRVMQTFSSDNAVIIQEVGVVIVEKDNTLVVDIVLGNNNRQSADIQKDDVVLMANGKKIKTIKDLREQYENTKTDNEFKIGMKRGDNLFIAKFIKGSSEKLNKAGGGFVMRMDKKEGELLLPALGLGVWTKDKNVVVNNVLPTAEKNFKAFMPKEGDIIVSINDKSVSKAEEFIKKYDAFNEGDKIAIVFSRDGKEIKETFNKPKPMGRMIFNRN